MNSKHYVVPGFLAAGTAAALLAACGGSGYSAGSGNTASASGSAAMSKPAVNDLGLWIANAFITANGGKVEVESEGADRGTTVTIHLPLSPEAERLETTVDD